MSAGPDRAPDQAPARGTSLWGESWRRLKKNKLAMVSFGFVLLLAATGFLSPLWESVWTHFSPTRLHPTLPNRAPGARHISIDHPTYDGDKRAFDVIDLDGDGLVRCRTVGAADAGYLDCPELQLADDVATGFYDKLLTDRWNNARGDADPVPGQRGGDRYLTWKEYPKDDLDLPDHLRGLGLAGPDAFRRLDVDGDHVISEWEIVERTRYLRYGSVTDIMKTFDGFVRDHDRDGDLAISRAEFPGAPELHTFLLGTDYQGRDVLTRLLYGARLSITIGLLATLVSLIIGVLYGATAGYVGGRTDNVMMRFVDVLYGLPFMFIVILLMVIIDDRNNVVLLFMALGAVQWLTMARVVRGQVLSLKSREFVEAARAIGVSQPAIVLRHIIPNAIGPVVVYATLLVPAVILEEAFLSFLGLGVEMSWGSMIAEGASDPLKIQDYPWLIAFPAMALAMTLFALNFLGDGVRDAMDPQLRGK